MANNDKPLEDGLGNMVDIHELTDEDLEGVAGGVLSPLAQNLLRSNITKYKNDGVTLDEALAALPGLFDSLSTNPAYKSLVAQTNLEEVTAFVKENW